MVISNTLITLCRLLLNYTIWGGIMEIKCMNILAAIIWLPLFNTQSMSTFKWPARSLYSAHACTVQCSSKSLAAIYLSWRPPPAARAPAPWPPLLLELSGIINFSGSVPTTSEKAREENISAQEICLVISKPQRDCRRRRRGNSLLRSCQTVTRFCTSCSRVISKFLFGGLQRPLRTAAGTSDGKSPQTPAKTIICAHGRARTHARTHRRSGWKLAHIWLPDPSLMVSCFYSTVI